ncbi:MAG TPA: OadG family protein [Acetivibrio sp.]|nr:OadG family protein [Acetivibrio sp.]
MSANLMQGLSITFVGVTVVFASLIILCAIIYLFSVLIPNKDKNSSNKDSDEKLIDISSNNNAEAEKLESNLSDDTLVAVLTAAVLASMGDRPDIKIRVTSFKRIQQTSPVWNVIGRKEYISNKLS